MRYQINNLHKYRCKGIKIKCVTYTKKMDFAHDRRQLLIILPPKADVPPHIYCGMRLRMYTGNNSSHNKLASLKLLQASVLFLPQTHTATLLESVLL